MSVSLLLCHYQVQINVQYYYNVRISIILFDEGAKSSSSKIVTKKVVKQPAAIRLKDFERQQLLKKGR